MQYQFSNLVLIEASLGLIVLLAFLFYFCENLFKLRFFCAEPYDQKFFCGMGRISPPQKNFACARRGAESSNSRAPAPQKICAEFILFKMDFCIGRKAGVNFLDKFLAKIGMDFELLFTLILMIVVTYLQIRDF